MPQAYLDFHVSRSPLSTHHLYLIASYCLTIFKLVPVPPYASRFHFLVFHAYIPLAFVKALCFVPERAFAFVEGAERGGKGAIICKRGAREKRGMG